MKLELKHIAPYLPYGLDAINKDNKQMAIMGCLDKQTVVVVNNGCLKGYDLKYVKPILRPLSSMTKEEASDLLSVAVFGCKTDHDDIDHISIEVENDDYIVISGMFKNSFYDDSTFKLYVIGDGLSYTVTSDDEEETPSVVNLSMYECLFENHFDVFGLINNALAIDKTKL